MNIPTGSIVITGFEAKSQDLDFWDNYIIQIKEVLVTNTVSQALGSKLGLKRILAEWLFASSVNDMGFAYSHKMSRGLILEKSAYLGAARSQGG